MTKLIPRLLKRTTVRPRRATKVFLVAKCRDPRGCERVRDGRRRSFAEGSCGESSGICKRL